MKKHNSGKALELAYSQAIRQIKLLETYGTKRDLEEVLLSFSLRWHPVINKMLTDGGIPTENGVIYRDFEYRLRGIDDEYLKECIFPNCAKLGQKDFYGAMDNIVKDSLIRDTAINYLNYGMDVLDYRREIILTPAGEVKVAMYPSAKEANLLDTRFAHKVDAWLWPGDSMNNEEACSFRQLNVQLFQETETTDKPLNVYADKLFHVKTNGNLILFPEDDIWFNDFTAAIIEDSLKAQIAILNLDKYVWMQEYQKPEQEPIEEDLDEERE